MDTHSLWQQAEIDERLGKAIRYLFYLGFLQTYAVLIAHSVDDLMEQGTRQVSSCSSWGNTDFALDMICLGEARIAIRLFAGQYLVSHSSYAD